MGFRCISRCSRAFHVSYRRILKCFGSKKFPGISKGFSFRGFQDVSEGLRGSRVSFIGIPEQFQEEYRDSFEKVCRFVGSEGLERFQIVSKV